MGSADNVPLSTHSRNFGFLLHCRVGRVPVGAAVDEGLFGCSIHSRGGRDHELRAGSICEGDRIWYDRCNFSGQFVHCVLINYPASEKRHWDSVVTRISHRLMRQPGAHGTAAHRLNLIGG